MINSYITILDFSVISGSHFAGSGFYFKLFFIVFLILVEIYFVLSHDKEKVDTFKVLPSGPGGKDPKRWLYYISAAMANLSAIITINIELKERRTKKLEQRLEVLKQENIKATEEIFRIKQSRDEEKREFYLIQGEKNKHAGNVARLDELSTDVDAEIKDFKSKVASDTVGPSELMARCEILKRKIGKYDEEHFSLKSVLTKNGIELPPKTDKTADPDKADTSSIDETPIHKSSILNFDFDLSIEWFKTLEGVQQLAVGIFLGKSVILSSLISIIFIFYGDILLDKYKIAEKYPKLAKIIELRKKYQKYYFKYNCLLILMVVITEYMVSLSLLAVTL